MKVKKKAFAKINFTLDLTGVLPNRYHGIYTLMQSAGVYDNVYVSDEIKGIHLSCSEHYIPCDRRNTAYLAAEYFFDSAKLEKNAEIYIDKVIPSGAGLAGGSADAAAVLHALDEIYPGRLSKKDLLSIALKIGADVPFCFLGGTKLCQNIGEIMSPMPELSSFMVIAKPSERVSTKDAYARFDSAENISHPDNNSFLFYAAKGDYKNAALYSSNIFETLCDVKSGSRIKNIMKDYGAWHASMSGSGSAFFGLFDSQKQADLCKEKLKPMCEKVFSCTTVGTGVE